ncbi:hypothetical protein AVEN_101537-1 [Araneus ventricosus]|uniref:Uncharacterized protein n=1 Tax=Araneus ventricosus TaxID=182803 RepID=A0A4Y2GSZ0_ARAVE|nr:hypothetical protein AVEN_101537-1 [Araneus ventricosus]
MKFEFSRLVINNPCEWGALGKENVHGICDQTGDINVGRGGCSLQKTKFRSGPPGGVGRIEAADSAFWTLLECPPKSIELNGRKQTSLWVKWNGAVYW